MIIKKILQATFTCIALLFLQPLLAQEPQESTSKWSFEIQLGLSKINTENTPGSSFYENKKAKISPVAGVFAEYQVKRIFSLVGGVEYEKSEYDYSHYTECFICDPVPPDTQSQNTVEYTSLKTKVLARLYIVRREKGSFYIQAGFYVSPYIKGEQFIEYVFPKDRPDEEFTINRLQDFDYGASVGLGVIIPIIKRHQLTLNLSLDPGFKQTYTDSQNEYRFVTFRGTIGYKYSL